MTETFKPDAAPLSPLKQAFLALERAQARIRELEADLPEPIAIVGIGCRIPGGQEGAEGYWSLLREGRSAVGDGVAERFSGLLRGAPLPVSAQRAALLEQIDLFDPRHFGIAPREATGMDPQQRLLLEVCWEALENAGIDPESLYQSATGVYVGLSLHDYEHLQLRGGDTGSIDPHFASGIASSVASGRISYVLGLNGPAVSLDTACSSSLVAVHLACEALRRRECSAALAGGVNLILSPEPSFAFAQAGMLSERGVCRAFDVGADGFVRGEGCGVLVLKRRGEALSSGDRILGWILSSAVNQDGASSGLTVPNGLAQQALLREAHRRAGIEADQVGYVEAHGTGTQLGDPIEAEALGSVFAGRKGKLGIGSVKTNIGHLESAAGVAGLIKVVLGMQHGKIPGQLHWKGPSEHVRWSELPLEVVTETRVWDPIDGRRIAGVSSFGFSGTNAHVVLESYTEPERGEEKLGEGVLVLSARTAWSLGRQAERYADFLEKTDSRWSDICYTAGAGRTGFGERLAVVAGSREEAAGKLRRWLETGVAEGGFYAGQVKASERSRGGKRVEASASAAEVAAGFVKGAVVDWASRASGQDVRRVGLPTYAFERERYWIAATVEPEVGERSGGAMLGRRLRCAGVRAQYETRLESSGWVGEHVVDGRVVLPATGHLELMLEAAADLGAAAVVEDVVLEAPLVVEGARRVQVAVEEPQGGRSRVRLYAEAKEKGWERCSEGWVREAAGGQEQPGEVVDLDGLRERLEAGPAGEDLYARLGELGLAFGERFRGMERVWTGPGEALGEITQREAAGTGWQLAPWWLDACLQTAGIAVGVQGEGDLYLPMSVDSLTVYARPEATAFSHVRIERTDPETLKAHVNVLNSNGQQLLHFHNLRFRKIKKQKIEVSSWLYKLAWEPAELHMRKQAAMLADETVKLEARFDELALAPQVIEYQAFFSELEQLSADYALQAFAELGWPDTNCATDIPSLIQTWNIQENHRRLFERLIEIAVETGAVSRDGASLTFGDRPGPVPTERVERLVQQFPFGKVEINLVVRCGEGLSSVLTGRLGGHELVFPGGQSEEMTSLYRDSTPARIFNDMVAGLISRAIKGRDSADTRVLEIGGGTGATTQYILDSLSDVSPSLLKDYLFTDISPLLVRRAQQKFGGVEGFRATVFDLERSAEEQGIEGPFSAIVAVNVIHATSDLSATLGRLKPLLSPDGVLLMVEVIGKQRWADITVGLLDGWWSFTDDEIRPDYPALGLGQWESFLKGEGFGRVNVFPKNPLDGSLFMRQQIILAAEPRRARKVVLAGHAALAEATRLQFDHCGLDAQTVDFEAVNEIDAAVDSVVWIADPESPGGDVPAGEASLAVKKQVSALLTATQALVREGQRSLPRLYIVTHGTDPAEIGADFQFSSSALEGLARGFAAELPELRCTIVRCGADTVARTALQLADEIHANDENLWVSWSFGNRSVARLQRVERCVEVKEPERVQLRAGCGIDDLAYVADVARSPGAEDVEIEVRATALNFRDVLQSMGVVNLDSPVGTDCAGVVKRVGEAVTEFSVGDRVVAIAPGSFASHIVTAKQLVVHKPKAMSYPQAAAQSVAYLTADYGLNEIAKIQSGERVLIHAAAGGVGLAAIHLCRQKGAIPIATAGSEKKRAFLRRLGVDQVYDSRSIAFASQISGGVDVVLNSLAGEAIDRGLDILSPGGRFIEMGKTDLRDPEKIASQWPNVTYHAIDLSPLFAARSPWVSYRLSQLLEDVAAGKLPMLPEKSFDTEHIHDAFRYMARAEHIGRIVVERTGPIAIRGTHLVTGGMRGIGLRLAEWLAVEGASSLVLVGRNTPDSAASTKIEQMRLAGISVQIAQGDIADPAVASEVIRLAGGDLRGVWHSAGLLDNASIEDQSWERMQHVFAPKIDGSWNLHVLTHDYDLDYFVMFSSWASVGGSHGQTNHCAANAFMDSLASLRNSSGRSGLSLNWGAWGETGAVASEELQKQLARSGMGTMAPSEALDAMRIALNRTEPQLAIAAINWPRYLAQHPSAGDRLFYRTFASLNGSTKDRKSNAAEASSSARESFEGIAGKADGQSSRSTSDASLARVVGDVIRRTLDLRADEKIDPDMPLSDLGMDSLLAVELRNTLAGALNRRFPSTILFDYPTLRDLIGHLGQELRPVTSEPLDEKRSVEEKPIAVEAGADVDRSFNILDEIEQMSDEEVDSLYQRDSRF